MAKKPKFSTGNMKRSTVLKAAGKKLKAAGGLKKGFKAKGAAGGAAGGASGGR